MFSCCTQVTGTVHHWDQILPLHWFFLAFFAFFSPQLINLNNLLSNWSWFDTTGLKFGQWQFHRYGLISNILFKTIIKHLFTRLCLNGLCRDSFLSLPMFGRWAIIATGPARPPAWLSLSNIALFAQFRLGQFMFYLQLAWFTRHCPGWFKWGLKRVLSLKIWIDTKNMLR